MKNIKIFLCVFLIFAMTAANLAGCGRDPDRTYQPQDYINFLYSDDIDENGFWAGIRAADYVEMFNYQAMTIPKDVHQITDAHVQSQVNNLLADFSSSEYITDRAVADGDKVNIDYVGSVGGVEFSGGSTGGMGAYVTAGSSEYIDDFLTQIIGHMPGDTVNVEVTFPENYGNEELNGKEALFVTVINYIVEEVINDLSDDFVAENLFDEHGWRTIDEMQKGIREILQKNSIQHYIQQYFLNEVTVKSVPDKLIRYQEKSMLSYYNEYASQYEMEIDGFLNAYVGVSGVDELLELNYDGNLQEATLSIITQAIAEDAGIAITDADLTNYFAKYYGSGDYTDYAEYFGLPYLKQNVLRLIVIDYISDRAVLE